MISREQRKHQPACTRRRTPGAATAIPACLLVLLFAFYPGRSGAEPLARLTAVEHSVGKSGAVELRFHFTGKADFKFRELPAHPDKKLLRRLYSDFKDVKIDKSVGSRTKEFAEGPVRKVRVGLNRPDVLRVVIGTDGMEGWEIETLKDPFRIVVRVKGKPSAPSPEKTAPVVPPPAAAPDKVKPETTVAKAPTPAPSLKTKETKTANEAGAPEKPIPTVDAKRGKNDKEIAKKDFDEKALEDVLDTGIDVDGNGAAPVRNML